MKRIQLKW